MKLVQNLQSDVNISTGPLVSPLLALEQFDMTEDAITEPGDPFYETEILENTSANAWVEYEFEGRPGKTLTYENLTPLTVEMQGNRAVQVGAGGTASIIIRDGGVEATTFAFVNGDITRTVTEATGYVAGSTADILTGALMALIDDTKENAYYLNYDVNATVAELNPNCPVYGIDLTALAYASSPHGVLSTNNRGALVTDQHFIGALHWNGNAGMAIGAEIKFRGSDGSTHLRTVMGKAKGIYDIEVYTLDSPLPVTVTPMPVLGDWLLRYREEFSNSTSITSYDGGAYGWVDQYNNFYYVNGTTTYRPQTPTFTVTYDGNEYAGIPMLVQIETTDMTDFAEFDTFAKRPVVGDSGSAVFAIIDGAAHLAGTWLSTGTFPFTGVENGAPLNDLINLADDNANITRTGKTVTVTSEPTETIIEEP